MSGAKEFLELAALHAFPVSDERCVEQRVPRGTYFAGRLYLTHEGEFVLTDGSPRDLPDHHPNVHNCDDMGCSSVSHVIARLAQANR